MRFNDLKVYMISQNRFWKVNYNVLVILTLIAYFKRFSLDACDFRLSHDRSIVHLGTFLNVVKRNIIGLPTT